MDTIDAMTGEYQTLGRLHDGAAVGGDLMMRDALIATLRACAAGIARARRVAGTRAREASTSGACAHLTPREAERAEDALREAADALETARVWRGRRSDTDVSCTHL